MVDGFSPPASEAPVERDRAVAVESARRLLRGEVDSLTGTAARRVCEQLLRALGLTP